MKLRVTLIQFEPGSGIMPNAMAVTDDYMEDYHNGLPPFYMKAVEDAVDGAGSDAEYREVIIEVPDDAILALFETPIIKAWRLNP